MWTRRQFTLCAAFASCAVVTNRKRDPATLRPAAAIVFESHLVASRWFAIARLGEGGVAIDLDRDTYRRSLHDAPDFMFRGFREVIGYTQTAAFAILEPAAIHHELYLRGRPSLHLYEGIRLVRWRLTTRPQDPNAAWA